MTKTESMDYNLSCSVRQGTQKMRVRSFPIHLLVLLYMLPIHHLQAQQEIEPLGQVLISLDRDWEYRWGDSPVDARGVPRWTYESDPPDAWLEVNFPSITDGLTGVYNRTYALERFEQEVSEAKRYRKRLSVIMFDLDHFKRVNDFFGHQVGDSVLQRVAQIFKYTMRDSDLIGRYGGEEFLIVLPETNCTEATLVAERIRMDVESQVWSEPQAHVTISGGVAEYGGGRAEQLLRRADSLMYQAKQLGRNRVVSETTLNRRSEADAG